MSVEAPAVEAPDARLAEAASMATNVDAARDEINAAIAVIKPQVEGLSDYGRLNLLPATAHEIDFSYGEFTRRLSLLQAALGALQALLDDGYPEMPVREIAQAAYDDLTANAATIQAALAKFASNAAVSMTMKSSAPEQK